MVICAHFAAAIPNLRTMELDIDEVPWKPKLLTKPGGLPTLGASQVTTAGIR